jgi:hypothetical protein
MGFQSHSFYPELSFIIQGLLENAATCRGANGNRPKIPPDFEDKMPTRLNAAIMILAASSEQPPTLLREIRVLYRSCVKGIDA